MKKALSVNSLKSFKPDPNKTIEIYDAGQPGLILAVFPSGKGSWIMRLRRADGRMGKLTLGAVDLGPGDPNATIGEPLTLAAARHFAADVRHQKALGVDVFAIKKDAVQAARQDIAETFAGQIDEVGIAEARLAKGSFAVLAREFIRLHAKPHVRRWIEMAKLLGYDKNLEMTPGGLSERWKHRLAVDIAKRDIVALLDEVRADTYPGAIRRRAAGVESEGSAGTMYRVLSKFYNWLIGRDLADRSPLTGLEKPKGSQPRTRVLTDAEIRAFWKAADSLGYPYGELYKFLLLTGVRVREAADMKRGEIDGGVWKVPKARGKNKREHFIPLAPMAAALLAKVDKKQDYMFSFGRLPVSGFAQAKRGLDQFVKLDDFVIHDLRRTFATRLASLKVPTPVIEACMNHTPPKLIRTYHHYNYAEERAAAYVAWEAKLKEILSADRAAARERHAVEAAI
jgi:integrase